MEFLLEEGAWEAECMPRPEGPNLGSRAKREGADSTPWPEREDLGVHWERN